MTRENLALHEYLLAAEAYGDDSWLALQEFTEEEADAYDRQPTDDELDAIDAEIALMVASARVMAIPFADFTVS